ncbi:hypothetical protein [Arthrobacter sunyaminii]|uniref:hypothetical protein n=1 Tax=Arthrobacter sunyaminii TaxID=2816859 RepID=UPI001A94F40B|nr:hypothetical protein [Arthrobacter sunyaminii]MBO0896025.1 hypothetical protein [Arthrobacter sunyaminii]
MKVYNSTFINEGISVKYRLKRATSDRHSLLVIFSGFRRPGTYDYDGAPAQSLRGNILWIQDDFFGDYAYYLCRGLDFAIERAVQSLISYILNDLKIGKENCIVAGFSKGGTAALFFGIKYGYGAIVATVPQFRPGYYMAGNWPEALSAIAGDGSSLRQAELDELLLRLVASDEEIQRNVYIVSSESDELHSVQVEPFISRFEKYSNFNYVLTDSPLVTNHIAVTRYNVPLLTGLFALLIEGIRPSFGKVINGSKPSIRTVSEEPDTSDEDEREVVAGFGAVALENGRLYPNGYGFHKGKPATEYGSVTTHLLLVGEGETFEYLLGGVRAPALSSRFYEEAFCDYSYAGFASIGHKGIPLAGIPSGQYEMQLRIRSHGITKTVAAAGDSSMTKWDVVGTQLVRVRSDKSSTTITLGDIVGPTPIDALWTMENFWSRGSVVHIEGHFAIRGVPAGAYADVDYYLIAKSLNGQGKTVVYPLAVGSKSRASTYFSDPWNDYSKAYYATPKYEGISLQGLTDGEYALTVSGRFKDSVFSAPMDLSLEVQANSTVFCLKRRE